MSSSVEAVDPVRRAGARELVGVRGAADVLDQRQRVVLAGLAVVGQPVAEGHGDRRAAVLVADGVAAGSAVHVVRVREREVAEGVVPRPAVEVVAAGAAVERVVPAVAVQAGRHAGAHHRVVPAPALEDLQRLERVVHEVVLALFAADQGPRRDGDRRRAGGVVQRVGAAATGDAVPAVVGRALVEAVVAVPAVEHVVPCARGPAAEHVSVAPAVDEVAAAAAVERVGAGAAVERVAPVAAAEHVAGAVAVEDVPEVVRRQRVGTGAADDALDRGGDAVALGLVAGCAGARVQLAVVTGHAVRIGRERSRPRGVVHDVGVPVAGRAAAVHHVGARPAVHHVGVLAPVEVVVAPQAGQSVVPPQALDHVRTGIAGEEVAAEEQLVRSAEVLEVHEVVVLARLAVRARRIREVDRDVQVLVLVADPVGVRPAVEVVGLRAGRVEDRVAARPAVHDVAAGERVDRVGAAVAGELVREVVAGQRVATAATVSSLEVVHDGVVLVRLAERNRVRAQVDGHGRRPRGVVQRVDPAASGHGVGARGRALVEAVVAGAAADGVEAARTAVEDIVARVPGDDVVATAAGKDVGAVVAHQDVGGGVAGQLVAGGAAVDGLDVGADRVALSRGAVVSGGSVEVRRDRRRARAVVDRVLVAIARRAAAVERVRSGAPVEVVGQSAAVEDVRPALAEEHVTSVAAEEDVRVVGADEHIARLGLRAARVLQRAVHVALARRTASEGQLHRDGLEAIAVADRVRVRPAVHVVGNRSPGVVEGVVARAAVEVVDVSAAVEGVGAGVPLEVVGERVAVQRVGARAARPVLDVILHLVELARAARRLERRQGDGHVLRARRVVQEVGAGPAVEEVRAVRRPALFEPVGGATAGVGVQPRARDEPRRDGARGREVVVAPAAVQRVGLAARDDDDVVVLAGEDLRVLGAGPGVGARRRNAVHLDAWRHRGDRDARLLGDPEEIVLVVDHDVVRLRPLVLVADDRAVERHGRIRHERSRARPRL